MSEHTPADLAYAAGFLDGEGAISILRVRSRRGGRDMYKVLVIVVNSNRPVLEGLHAQFGGHLYDSGFKAKPANWRATYQWHLYGDDCERFIRHVRPYLRIKGVVADSALEFFALQRERGAKRDTPPEVWARMKKLHAEHRVLNLKGVAPRRRSASDVAISDTAESEQMEFL